MAAKIRHLEFNETVRTGIDFIDIDQDYARNKKNLAVPHRASFYCILWVRSGEIIHQVDFQPIEIGENTYLFVQKDAVQFFDHEHAFSSRVLIFTETFFCKSEGDYQLLKGTALFNDLCEGIAAVKVKATGPLKSLWKFMDREFEHLDDPFRMELLRNYLHAFVLSAEREYKGSRQEQVVPFQSTQLIAFRKLLEENFRKQEHIGFYADKLAITNKALTHITTKTVGKSPKQLADERLLLEAKRMIIYGQDSGKMIGASLGFREPTNFIKFFKKHTGITPTAFRKKYAITFVPGGSED